MQPVLKQSAASEAASDRRRDYALGLVAVVCLLMVIIVSVALYYVRESAMYTFYMGLAAQANIVVGTTGILALLVKRRVSLSKSQINISDFDDTDDAIPREDAQAAVTEALEEVPALTPDGTNNKPS